MNIKAGYSVKVFLITFLLLSNAFLIVAQTIKKPNNEESQPTIDSLKIDRYNVEFLIAEGMHFLAIEEKDKAVQSFMKAHAIMPNNAALNYQVARIFNNKEEWDQALLFVTKATEVEKKNYFYHVLKAEILRSKGDLIAAVQAYEEVYEFSDNAPDEYLLELAALYLYTEKPEMALKTYNRIEKRLGVLEEVSTQKQKIYLKQNKLKEAIEEGKRLAKAYPKVSAYVVSVAQVLVSNGKKEEAKKYLEKYLDEHPNQAVAEMELAKLYRQTNDIDLALKYFSKAFNSEEIPLEDKLNNLVALLQSLSSSPLLKNLRPLGQSILLKHSTDANAFAVNGDLFFALDQKDSAQYYYKKAVEINGNNLQIWQNLLSLEMENSKYKSVVLYADEALSYFPNQPILYLYAGSGHFALKEFRKAIAIWEQGKSIVYGNDRLKSSFAAQLADAYHADKQYEKAFQAYEEAIKLNPINYFAINNYAYYLSLKKKNLDRALQLSSRMAKANPQNATFLDTHAWVLFQKEEYKEALGFLEKAVEIQASATIVEHYADALFKVGKRDEAWEQWKRAKSLGGASELIDKKIAEKKYYDASI